MTKEQLIQTITTVVQGIMTETFKSKWRCEKCNDQSFFGPENMHSFGNCDGKINKELMSRGLSLSDILITIGKKGKSIKMEMGNIDKPILLAISTDRQHYWYYDMQKSLQDQSLETLQFIANLIV